MVESHVYAVEKVRFYRKGTLECCEGAIVKRFIEKEHFQ